MADEQKLREQMDACRADSDDLQLPELRELAAAVEHNAPLAQQFARTQQFDRAIRSAVHDVPVPAGLLEQLLASASQVATSDQAAKQIADDKLLTEPTLETSVELSAKPAALTNRVNRARILAILTTIAAVAVLALSIRAYLPTPQNVVTANELSERAERWMAESLPAAGWNSSLAQAPLKTHPLDPNVRVAPHKWRPLATADDSRAAVYDLTRPGQQRALLFVLKSPTKYSVAAPPAYTKLLASRGMRVVAWQRGEHLYVLAVQEGDGQRLDDFLARPRLTLHCSPVRRSLAA